MKKRLLISSALMTAVLACALGTGTYAWYSATNQATVSAAKGANIATTKPNINVGAVTLGATIAEVTPGSKLHLATIESGAYKHYYLNAGGNKVAYQLGEGEVASKAYKFTLTVTEEQRELVAGTQVTISVAGDEGSTSRAKYWISSTALADGALWTDQSKTSVSLTLENTAKSYDYWVAVYVDGENTVADTDELVANFTVSVA